MTDAQDGFDVYYAEKLWELIPPYYRDLDGEHQPPGVLRAVVEVLAEQAAILRRSQDRLWQDQFIEHADDWAVPYLGDLVGTRMVSALLARAQRIDVAKTVYYRRRAGTLRVLEELIVDIAGFEGVVREGFRLLARAPHGLDPELTAPGARRGRWSGTPAGGLADLRHPLAAELAHGAFDEYHHSADLRRPRGRSGQYGIPRIAFHAYRLISNRVEGVTPRTFTGGPDPFFTFDPSGRDIPLFARRTRAQALSSGIVTESPVFGVPSAASPWEEWTSALPWQIPAPIRCRLLGDVAYQLDADLLAPVMPTLAAATQTALAPLFGRRVLGEQRLIMLLWPSGGVVANDLAAIRAATLAPDCGKAVLLHPTLGSLRILPDGANALAVNRLQADDLSSAAVTFASWQDAAIDAELGRFVLRPSLVDPALLADYHYGFPGAIGAGVYERDAIAFVDPDWESALTGPTVALTGGGAVPALGGPNGLIEIEDNQTYVGVADQPSIELLALRAPDGLRPYVLLDDDVVFTAAGGVDAVLVLDGLWFGAQGAQRDVVLAGDFERVELRCCTLDPGGLAADGSALPSVRIRVEGSVELLSLQSCIASSIVIGATGAVTRLDLNDSILQATTPIALPDGELHVARSTVLGEVSALRLWASDSLFSAAVTVVDVQNGCFRFSAAHEDSVEHVPHPYQSVFFADAGALFSSTRFGDPDYALLSEAPEVALTASADDVDGEASIHGGAENGGEMGAWNALLLPVKARAMRTKVEEFLPFGLLPVFVNED